MKNKPKQIIKSILTYLVINILKKGRQMGIIPNFPMVKDRAIEYAFASEELSKLKGKKILDVGFLESVFPFILAGFDYDVHAIDFRKLPRDYTKFKTYVGDIRKTEFSNDSFDAVTAISTIEHLGIPTRYGSYNDPDADRKALAEMLRIVKKRGKLVITMPFGKYQVDSAQRIYDKKHLDNLLQGLNVKRLEFAKQYGNCWNFSTYNEVKNIKGYHAVVLVCIIK